MIKQSSGGNSYVVLLDSAPQKEKSVRKIRIKSNSQIENLSI